MKLYVSTASRSMCARCAAPRTSGAPTGLAHEAARAQRFAEVFETKMSDPVMREPLTMAHLILAVAMDEARRRGSADLTIGRLQLAAWMRRMSELPAMRATARAGASAAGLFRPAY